MGPPGTTAPPVGSPASTAGYGPYGFQTYDQWYQGNKAITGAQNRVTDINAQVTEKQKQLDQLNAEITAEQNKSLLLRDQAKLDSKTQERDRLQGEITKLRNTDLPAASEDVEQATRKAWEDAQKPPGGQQEYKIPGASEFSQLGGGLVKGKRSVSVTSLRNPRGNGES
jgi:septal ring factor EnvC (AmiA/AmiB activator)